MKLMSKSKSFLCLQHHTEALHTNPVIQKFVAKIEKAIDSSSIVLLSNIQKYFGPGEETVYR